MRHKRHRSRLNRTTEHRAALMRNLACALIEHGIIRTTEPKAKQLRQFAERIITIAKEGLATDSSSVALAKRRLTFTYLNNKEAVKKLFADVAPRAQRPGGYTRVVKDGRLRVGDGAPMAYIEIVDRVIAEPATEKKKKSAQAAAK